MLDRLILDFSHASGSPVPPYHTCNGLDPRINPLIHPHIKSHQIPHQWDETKSPFLTRHQCITTRYTELIRLNRPNRPSGFQTHHWKENVLSLRLRTVYSTDEQLNMPGSRLWVLHRPVTVLSEAISKPTVIRTGSVFHQATIKPSFRASPVENVKDSRYGLHICRFPHFRSGGLGYAL